MNPSWHDLGETSELTDLLSTPESDLDPGESFDKRILREWSLYRHARTLRFWTPALVGAAIASLAVLAAVEMVFVAPVKARPATQGQEAKRTVGRALPDFSDPGTRINVR